MVRLIGPCKGYVRYMSQNKISGVGIDMRHPVSERYARDEGFSS
jgi:hypothetical protein